MTSITKNNKGEQVIATNPYYYAKVVSNESVYCCDEYQVVMYCFVSDTEQGCSYCEYDIDSKCECAVCEK